MRRLLWWSGWPARLILRGLIRGYRLSLASLVGGNCRFYPSCSEYADRAIAQVGAVKGGALALWRILRCSPLSAGGVDPPPLSASARLYDTAIRREVGPESGDRAREKSA